jgi:hypothetical protein
MNSVSQDSAKLLTEKLALSRELNTLKPELEHLKSQLSHQQSVIAEKLSLQRQLNSLEVELEAEKRARQRATQKEDDGEVESELRRKLTDTEKKLAAEKKESQRLRKEAERTQSELTGRCETLEQRLDLMKTKLRDTQTELKTCREALDHARQSTTLVADLTETMTVPVKNPIRRKRRAAEMMTDDATIATPGNVSRLAKKRGVGHAPVGEKSTFSITPFLNRTVNLGDESHASPNSPAGEIENNPTAAGDEQNVAAVASPAPVPTPKLKMKAAAPLKEKTRGRPKKALAEAPDSKKNIPAAKVARKASKAATTLDKVEEESDMEDKENKATEKPVVSAALIKKVTELKLKAVAADGRSSSGSITSSGSSRLEQEPKKKKRKLLGGADGTKTLFDDEDVEAVKRTAKVQLGPARKLGKAVLGGALGGAGGNAFAKSTFSPLKKDRRGVGASFLA